MANPIMMPKAGITVESCILTKWNVKVGDTVKVGDVICSYETDKSAFDLTAEVEGEVLALFCEEGDEVPVLTNIAAVGAKGEDVSALAPNGAAAPAVEEVKVEAAPAAAPVSGNAIKTPLPGVIIDVKVNVGDTVKKGDTVVVLEAMKMENNINSDRDGKVTAIQVAKGDTVADGAVLIVIE